MPQPAEKSNSITALAQSLIMPKNELNNNDKKKSQIISNAPLNSTINKQKLESTDDYINYKPTPKTLVKHKSDPLVKPISESNKSQSQEPSDDSYGKYGNGRYSKIDKLYNSRDTIVYRAKDTQKQKE